MHDLQPITALGGLETRIDKFERIIITENDDLALASVAARKGYENDCRDKIKKILGDIPKPGQATLDNTEVGFWIAPDQWMIKAPKSTHELLANNLKSFFLNTASITEQSGAWVCFDLTGSGVSEVMERLCAAPIRKMEVGEAQRTTIHQLSCFVLCLKNQTHIRIFGPRASAATLHHAFMIAAKSCA